MPAWRLLTTPPAAGAWNMAVDEAVLEASACGDSPPTLRLYAWQPACLSLGYSQSAADVDISRLHTRGWDLVRRATGGRAVLHIDELTYSVTGPVSDPILAGSLLDSYHRLAAALVAALQSLGLHIDVQRHQKASPDSNPVCFEIPSASEITCRGRKLVGSAQSRRMQGVLQHGSLPLHGDITRIIEVLTFPDGAARTEARRRLDAGATTLQAALGETVSWKAAAQALAAAFQKCLQIDLQPGILTGSEQERVEIFVNQKFDSSAWTFRA